MYGRLLKAVEDDANRNTIPSFKRMGYGTKLAYEKQNHKIGIIGFYAKDQINSILIVPDKKNVTPKENLVVGITGESQVSKVLRLSAEYSNSTINQDLRAENSDSKKGLSGLFLKNKTSAQNFSALKVAFDFRVDKMVLGTSYERIDPNYQTLGAYYFVNDLENVMVNLSRPFIKDKLTLAFNIGVQRDNLDNKKSATTKRFVGSVNATAKFSENLMSNFNYSNQSSTSNVNPDQFFQINQSDPQFNNVDQLNFRQLSQNANINTNYNFKPTEISKKNIVLNYSFNQVANEQSGIIRPGQLSSFHNFNAAYIHGLVKSMLNFSSSLNYTLNTIGRENSKTYGPSFGINKKFLKDKLNTQFSSAYNISQSQQSNSSNINFRFNMGYVYAEHHNFSMNASQLLRNASGSNASTSSINELTVVLSYGYNFSGKKSKNSESTSEKNLKKKQENQQAKSIKSEFNDNKIEGNSQLVFKTIFDTINSAKRVLNTSIDQYIKTQKLLLAQTVTVITKTQNKDSLKIAKQNFNTQITDLDTKWREFVIFDNQFHEVCKAAYLKLKNESKQNSIGYESKYFVKKYNIKIEDNSDKFDDFSEIEKYIRDNKIELIKRDKGRLAHFNLLTILAETKTDQDFLNKPEMQQLFENEKENHYQLFLKRTKPEELINKMEVKIADYYLKNHISSFD